MTFPLLDRLRAAVADGYQVEREIGAGGMATVFLARDLRHRREVAIKVLRPEFAAALGADRFLREIQLTAGLHHPNILPLFDSGEADGLLFYVMPRAEGETLRDRLDREHRLPVADAIRLAGDVASALDYAHRHGVIHRDIKPENVLLQDGRAVVADFGIALSPSTDPDRLTSTGISIGTPQYMSPEQALGQREVGARTDIYSLGAVLYEMLTGAPPFSGANAQAVVARVLTETAASPARLRPDVPTPVSRAVMTALKKDPDARFASAAAFQAALELPAPVGGVRRFWPAVAVAGVGAIGIAIAVAYARRAPSAAPAPAPLAAAHRIAVIPFRNANGDSNTGFSEGLTLEINDALSRLPGLTVVVASSTKYRGAGVDVAAAGRELGVDAVLTGQVDTAGNVVRVQAQLQDAATGALRWSDKYDRPLKDLYTLEDTLSLAIAGDLRLEAATNGQLAAARAGRTASPEAHALLVEARGDAERRTPEALAAAITLFTAAIHLDSSYAQAWAGRATAENLTVAYDVAWPASQFPNARADAAMAITLDNTVADAHASLGFIHVFSDRDWPAAAAEFARALALDSTAAPTWLFRGWYFVAVDQLDSAAASLRTAARLAPAAPIYDTRLGTVLYMAGDLSGAEGALGAALRRDGSFGFAHSQLAQVYADDGQCGKALAEAAYPGSRVSGAFEVEYTWARCGKAVEARQFTVEAVARRRSGALVDAFWLAAVYAGLRDESKVFEWLNRAVAEQSWALFMLRRHPAFQPYRADPRFGAIMRRVNLN